MAVLWSPESAYVKELAKWELRPTEHVSMGMLQALGKSGNPPYQEFPKMLYQAKAHTGGPVISGQQVVESEVEETLWLHRGWATSQEAAIEAVHAHDRAIAQAAAERAFTDRRMGDQARAEAARADDATPQHVASVPVKPIRKRRPYVRKTQETT